MIEAPAHVKGECLVVGFALDLKYIREAGW